MSMNNLSWLNCWNDATKVKLSGTVTIHLEAVRAERVGYLLHHSWPITEIPNKINLFEGYGMFEQIPNWPMGNLCYIKTLALTMKTNPNLCEEDIVGVGNRLWCSTLINSATQHVLIMYLFNLEVKQIKEVTTLWNKHWIRVGFNPWYGLWYFKRVMSDQ